jgi:hypothetical protein
VSGSLLSLSAKPNAATIVQGSWRYRGPESVYGLPFISRETPSEAVAVFCERCVAYFVNVKVWIGTVVAIALRF